MLYKITGLEYSVCITTTSLTTWNAATSSLEYISHLVVGNEEYHVQPQQRGNFINKVEIWPGHWGPQFPFSNPNYMDVAPIEFVGRSTYVARGGGFGFKTNNPTLARNCCGISEGHGGRRAGAGSQFQVFSRRIFLYHNRRKNFPPPIGIAKATYCTNRSFLDDLPDKHWPV